MSRYASGFKAWLIQRISAVYLAFVSLYGFYYFLFFTPLSYESWTQWVLTTPIMLGILLLLAFLLVHAWVGIRDILIDYISHTGMRLILMSLVGMLIIASGLWGFQILLLAKLSQQA